MLDDHALPKHLSLSHGQSLAMVGVMCPHLVHLEETRIYLAPVWYAHRNRVKLRGMFMKGPVFELMDPHNLHEVQIGGREWRV